MSLRLAPTMTSTYVLDDGGLNVTSAMERGGGGGFAMGVADKQTSIRSSSSISLYRYYSDITEITSLALNEAMDVLSLPIDRIVLRHENIGIINFWFQ